MDARQHNAARGPLLWWHPRFGRVSPNLLRLLLEDRL
jgi:hypothetical protein